MGNENRKYSILLVLIIAGELIFFLPTKLDYFQVTNSELGLWFALYGLVAMASYLAGGPLADKFSARRLMTLALTSIGGFMMAYVPRPGMMRAIYVLWGFTTICLFWAAMIRSTRLWGEDRFQGRAFGWSLWPHRYGP